MDLDIILSSPYRCKILRVLSKIGPTNVMDLVRRTNSTYSQVNKNLLILKKEGTIIDRRFERVRIVKLEKKSHKTRLLILALQILDNEMYLANRKPAIQKEEKENNPDAENTDVTDKVAAFFKENQGQYNV